MAFTVTLEPGEMDDLAVSLQTLGDSLASMTPPVGDAGTLGTADLASAAGDLGSHATERAVEVAEWITLASASVTSTREEFEATDAAAKARFERLASAGFASADRED